MCLNRVLLAVAAVLLIVCLINGWIFAAFINFAVLVWCLYDEITYSESQY